MSNATFPGAWHAVAWTLREGGVDTVFGLPGDDLALVPALEAEGLRLVACNDQRNAVYMAAGHALQSGTPAACAVGKGPALTNALTGLLEARSSCAPVVLVSGGTAAHRRGAGAFQELDQLPLAQPLTQWAYRADHPATVVPALRKALLVAAHGVPGPTYVEVPDSLADAEIDAPGGRPAPPVAPPRPAPEALEAVAGVLRAARRPALLAGGGLRHRNHGQVEHLAEVLGAAVFSTASGRGAIDEDHGLYCGLAGLYAGDAVADLLRASDCVVTLGSRLEETATFGWADRGAPGRVVQVNLEPAEIAAWAPGPVVLGDAAHAAAAWGACLSRTATDGAWTSAVADARAALFRSADADLARRRARDRIHVAEVLAELADATAGDRVLVQENGLQDMWSYCFPYWRVGRAAGSVVPSEQTSLGFGAAAAVGVRLAAGSRDVVALAGDGAFGMLGADLSTVAREQVPVLYVVLDNGGYGWLQAQLEAKGLDGGSIRFAGHGEAAGWRLEGIEHVVVPAKRDLRHSVRRALEVTRGGRPAVLRVAVHLDDAPPLAEDLAAPLPGGPPEPGAPEAPARPRREHGP